MCSSDLTVINEALARVQAEGGIAQGIGHALYEIVEHDERGRLRTGNFMSYKLPTRLDIGSIRVAFEPSYEPTGPFGAKSIGEVVINTPLAAVASAVAHATMAARCQVPWERAAFVSLHGTDQNVIHAISTHEHTFILLGGMMTAEIFLEKMAWYGLDDLKAAAGRNLSYEDEVFYSGAVRDMTPEMLSGLTVLWVHHPEYDARVGRHLEDRELIRGSVPMTKSSVRAMVIAALRLQEDSVVYDIGAGTGSVAVETAMQGGGIRVYAIERNPEGVRLVQENKRRWRTDNVTVVEGDAPEALHDLPAPTHVFIGGSGGRLREMIDVCLSKSPNARIVVTAVSLETVQEMAGLLQEERWKETDVIQIQTACSRKLGDYHMMMGQNPVWMAVLQGGGEDSDE